MPRLESRVRVIEGSTSVATSRSHAVVIDRPETKGGSDTGFQGGELLLASLGGCFLSNIVAAARTRNVLLDRAEASVVGETVDAPARFGTIVLELNIQSAASDDVVEKLVLMAERACIVTNTLRRGTDLSIRRVKSR